MDALVEVHTLEELKAAQAMEATLIGVNNRDLHTLSVSLDVSRDLIRHKKPGTLMIAESGISKREELAELKTLGFDGFLVGESLMRAGDAAAMLEEWV
jgi:indole-3-glycerol phosphate synthase